MKITIESTDKIVGLSRDPLGRSTPGSGRWHTESGIPVHCYVTRIAVADDADCAQFERELMECRPPTPVVAALPTKMVI